MQKGTRKIRTPILNSKKQSYHVNMLHFLRRNNQFSNLQKLHKYSRRYNHRDIIEVSCKPGTRKNPIFSLPRACLV